MPTGYTAKVQDGTATTKQFLTHLAEAFGIGGDRDADEFREVERQREQLALYWSSLVELNAMTPAQAEAKAQEAYAKRVQEWDESRTKTATERARYEAALRDVQAWQVPKEVKPIKEYAIEQLLQSINHDCGEFAIPVLQSGQEWLEDRKRFASRMVESYTRYVAEAEQQRDEKQARRMAFAEAITRV